MPSSVAALTSPVESYRLQLTSTGSSGTVTTEKTFAESRLCTGGCTAAITDVTPFTTYSLRLRAVNNVGTGVANAVAASVTTAASVPDAVKGLNVSVPSSGTELLVSWSSPSPNGAALTGVKVDA